ncbi:MAG: hypothetical protein IJW55_03910 [Clostridia bacterium]|nr:hypothetical protein [Clostridia bacterium]
MKTYFSPELMFLLLDNEDVISTSNGTTTPAYDPEERGDNELPIVKS